MKEGKIQKQIKKFLEKWDVQEDSEKEFWRIINRAKGKFPLSVEENAYDTWFVKYLGDKE